MARSRRPSGRIGRHLDQAGHLVGVEHLRQLARRLRRAQALRRVAGQFAVLEQVPEETAQRRQPALQAFRRQAAPVFGGDEAAQVLADQAA